METSPFEKAIDMSLGVSFSGLIGLLGIAFLFLYLIFAFIIVRQVTLLTRTLGTALSPWLKFIALLHFGFSVIILLVAIGLL